MPRKIRSERPEKPELGLKTLFGDNVVIRVLDFLILYGDSEYSMSEIARNSYISWRSFNRIWPIITALGIVTETRKLGPSRMYKLNKESPITQNLTKLADEIAFHEAHKTAVEELQKEAAKVIPAT